MSVVIVIKIKGFDMKYMNYAIAGLFTAAATAGIAGIATGNGIAIAGAGVAFGLASLGGASVTLGFFGGLALAAVGIDKSDSMPRNKTAGYVVGAFLGIAAGLGFNALTDMPETTVPAPAPQSQSVTNNLG